MFIVYKYPIDRQTGAPDRTERIQYFCKDGEWHLPARAESVGFHIFLTHESMERFCHSVCFETVQIQGKPVEVKTGYACPSITLPV